MFSDSKRNDAYQSGLPSFPSLKTSYSEKKRSSIIRTYDEPVLPKLCYIFWYGMFLITISMLLVDANAFIRYDFALGWKHLYINLVTTGFSSWIFFTSILVPISVITILQNTKRYLKRTNIPSLSLIQEMDITKYQQIKTSLYKQSKFYRHIIKICLFGSILWGISFVLSFY